MRLSCSFMIRALHPYKQQTQNHLLELLTYSKHNFQVKSVREIALNLIEFQLLFNSLDPLSFHSCNFICFRFQ